MPTVHTAAGPTRLDDTEARTLRRSGVQLIAGFGAFLLGLICVIVGGSLTGTEQAEATAAAQRGINVNDLPADVLATIHRDDSWVGSVLVALPLVLAAVLLVLGVRSAARVARQRALGVTATALAACSALAWIFGQAVGPFYSAPLQPLVFPGVIASTALGCAAFVVLVVVLRGRGVARRTGLVVGVLAVLATVGAFFLVPPFMPYIFALVIGIPLARTRPSPTM